MRYLFVLGLLGVLELIVSIFVG